MWFDDKGFRQMTKKEIVNTYIEFVWAKESLMEFPKREQCGFYDHELDLTVNPSWIEWEIEMLGL